MRLFLALLAVLLVACGDPSSAGAGDSSSPSATTTVSPTNTTTETSTSTTIAATTSAARDTTTSLVTDVPLVVSSSGLLGYHDGTDWVPGEAIFEVEAGEEYQVVGLAGVRGTAIGSSLEICEPSQTPIIALDPPLPVGHDEPGAVAIAGATWNLLPRPVFTDGTPPRDLVEKAIAFIADRALSDPDPAVAQYLTFDLEGDGVEEELLVVNRIPEDLFGNAESYSLVMMRKTLDVEPAILVIEFSQGSPDSAYVVFHVVTAVVDLNGDGKMEIVVDGHYYEGSGSTAWEYVDNDLGTVAALSAGCGA
ncbi:MAG TPA: hypothetical protein VJ796_06660 [Acidimicrobiia bacterium]|nr:hypothetical protein [Acidimicrobiia bacterium]